MKFLTTVNYDEAGGWLQGPPPPEFLEACDAMAAKYGDFLIDTAGLVPAAEATQMVLSDGKISVTDGPYSEAKEVIGGFSLCEVESQEQATEMLTAFVEAHQQHWPGAKIRCEMRRLL